MSFRSKGHENDWHDAYHDDPIAEKPNRKVRRNILNSLAVIVGSLLFFQTTLATNISLGTGPLEFGQGIVQAVACSGATNLTITPNSTFTNTSGGGSFYFSSVTVSNIPVGCYGKDFTIRAYGNSSSTPLALFNTTSTDAVIYNNGGTFETGAGSTGATVSSASGTFTATFTSPVALATSVFKVTLESGAHSGIVYNVGDIGPGGGRIFYKNVAGFSCGASFTDTGSPTGEKCKYLEVAPNTWITPSDSTTVLLGNRTDAEVVGVRKDASAIFSVNDVGLGYKNSLIFFNDSRAIANTGIKYVRNYNGGSLSDWYVPNSTELNLLVYWSKGLTPDVNARCTSNASIVNGDFNTSYYYYSSSQNSGPASFYGWIQSFSNGGVVGNQWSDTGMRVRPIRAF
jgi:hypothetical protein